MEKFVPKKPEKETISVRISDTMLQEVERRAADADISRNEFIIQCIRFALNHMDDPDQEENQ